MRDLERWKDQVELSLDGRQIFVLFFGSAVIACFLFIAGLLVGKRMEDRALATSAVAVEDPLQALDQLADGDEGLTFHEALAQDPRRAHRAERSRQGEPVRAEVRPEAVAAKKPDATTTAAAGAKKPDPPVALAAKRPDPAIAIAAKKSAPAGAAKKPELATAGAAKKPELAAAATKKPASVATKRPDTAPTTKKPDAAKRTG